jgi:MlaD protein
MALQDLTPQLRTRLNRMERAVGWFVFLATALLVLGFGYYVYSTAKSKGWFLIKAKFYTYIHSAAGLNIGDPVVVMGFQVGQITGITAMPPRNPNDIRIDFEIHEPYYTYIWSQGSIVKVNASDFLGKRSLEVTRGTNGFGIYNTHPVETLTLEEARDLADPDEWRLAENIFDDNSNRVLRAYTQLWPSNVTQIAELNHDSILAFHSSLRRHYIASIWNEQFQRYETYNHRDDSDTNAYELPAVESPAVTEQLQAMITQVKSALPGILSLTNKITTVLDNAANATSNLNVAVAAAQPLLTNAALISGQLRKPGGLGVWALGTNGNQQLQGSLTNVNSLLVHSDTNLMQMSENINATLIHLADITSNLNAQVQANTNMLSGISKAISDADDFVQGMKRFWLFRSAFKTGETNAPPSAIAPAQSPRGAAHD